jgi:hypothetical protein
MEAAPQEKPEFFTGFSPWKLDKRNRTPGGGGKDPSGLRCNALFEIASGKLALMFALKEV